jgi:hypothetical protein
MIAHMAIAKQFKAGKSVEQLVADVRQDSFNQRGRRIGVQTALVYVEHAIRQELKRQRLTDLQRDLTAATADNAALRDEISGAMDSLESEIPAERKARWERLQALSDIAHPGDKEG